MKWIFVEMSKRCSAHLLTHPTGVFSTISLVSLETRHRALPNLPCFLYEKKVIAGGIRAWFAIQSELYFPTRIRSCNASKTSNYLFLLRCEAFSLKCQQCTLRSIELASATAQRYSAKTSELRDHYVSLTQRCSTSLVFVILDELYK